MNDDLSDDLSTTVFLGSERRAAKTIETRVIQTFCRAYMRVA